MSGIETIKIIVDAEKEAAKILTDAQTRAVEIRKGLDALIQEQRTEDLRAAKSEAAALIQKAEDDSKSEAQEIEREAEIRIRKVVTDASAKKGRAIDRLVSVIMEMNA